MTVPSRRRTLEFVDKRKGRQQALLFARVVLIALGGLVWLLPLLRSTVELGKLGRFLDGLFIMVCHRDPARSLTFTGVEMPVCSRCAGLYAGLALGAWIARPILSRRTSRWALGGALLLMLTDVISHDLGMRPLWHSARLSTGFAVGYIASIALVAAMRPRNEALEPLD